MERRAEINGRQRGSTGGNSSIPTSGSSISAGQRRSRTPLGVKGSQVQILSSRRPRGSSQARACRGPLRDLDQAFEVEHSTPRHLDSEDSTMPLLDLNKITLGLSRTWAGIPA